MRYEVKVPQQGYTTEYVTIAKWHISVGDEIKEGMPIYEMESEKTVMDVASPCSGRVAAILKDAGEEADIGETIMLIDV